ncbi:riboflavin synthase [bacterium MnTg04]|nr:riboflavin synthase [bacterium MnTg04]
MFSGIIQAIGSIKSRQPKGGDLMLEINAPGLGLDQVAIGDSIAVDGVCLTATAVNEHGFVADLSTETLACSALGRKRAGAPLNLEKALCLGDALGGHLVSGHVDAVGKLLGRRDDARSVVMTFSLPESVARFVAAKGSICIDGVSLTVNRVTDDSFTINVVPHTLEATTMGRYRGGTEVNLEVDLVARYIDRLMGGDRGI